MATSCNYIIYNSNLQRVLRPIVTYIIYNQQFTKCDILVLLAGAGCTFFLFFGFFLHCVFFCLFTVLVFGRYFFFVLYFR